MVTFLFSVPFLILSMPGGWLADRFSKRQITIWTKVMEFGSMLLATAGLATHTLGLSLAALTLVASQAALFGPSKYGLLPELAAGEEPVVGQRRNRAGNVSRDHRRHRRRRLDGRAFHRARGVRGICAAGSLGDWIRDRAWASTTCRPRRRKNHSA